MDAISFFDALNRDYSISTDYWTGERMSITGVNALFRAYSISTVLSENPLCMRFPGPIFAGNCLNILKI